MRGTASGEDRDGNFRSKISYLRNGGGLECRPKIGRGSSEKICGRSRWYSAGCVRSSGTGLCRCLRHVSKAAMISFHWPDAKGSALLNDNRLDDKRNETRLLELFSIWQVVRKQLKLSHWRLTPSLPTIMNSLDANDGTDGVIRCATLLRNPTAIASIWNFAD